MQQLASDDAEASPVEILQAIVPGSPEAGAELAKLVAYDLDPNVSQCAASLLCLALEGKGVPPRDKPLLQEAAKPVLYAALHDPDLPDDRKYHAGPLYILCGGQMDSQELCSVFRDFEGTARRNVREAFRGLSDQPDGISQALFSLGLLEGGKAAPTEEAFYRVTELGLDLLEVNRDAAATLLAAVVAMAAGHGAAGEEAHRALDALAEAPCERTAWCLAELASWPAMGDLGAKARALRNAMGARGVAPAYHLTSKFSRALLSAVDGAGTRSMALFFRSPDGQLDLCTVLLNDVVGVKDAWCSFGNAEEIEAQLQGRGELVLAPCSPALAREVLADAAAIHAERGTPFPGPLFVCRPYLGPEPLAARRRTPDLRAYPIDRIERTPAMFEGCEVLHHHPAYGAFTFTSDAAYAFLSSNPVRNDGTVPSEKFETFVREIAARDKDVLLARMAANLEVEALAGRASDEANQTAARAWLGLRDAVVPFHEVPYVRRLCEESIGMVAQNLRLGFRSQAEADRAALALDLPSPEDEGDGDGDADDEFSGNRFRRF